MEVGVGLEHIVLMDISAFGDLSKALQSRVLLNVLAATLQGRA